MASTMVNEVELCSASVGKGDGNRLILALRFPETGYAIQNIGFRPVDAVRLWRDLCFLASNSPLMKKAIAEEPDLYENFKAIATDKPPVVQEK
jgi:hypothetical protein